VSEFERLFDAVKEKMTVGMKGGNKATAATSTEVVDVLTLNNPRSSYQKK
jgi:hypothetical protein